MYYGKHAKKCLILIQKQAIKRVPLYYSNTIHGCSGGGVVVEDDDT